MLLDNPAHGLQLLPGLLVVLEQRGHDLAIHSGVALERPLLPAIGSTVVILPHGLAIGQALGVKILGDVLECSRFLGRLHRGGHDELHLHAEASSAVSIGGTVEHAAVGVVQIPGRSRLLVVGVEALRVVGVARISRRPPIRQRLTIQLVALLDALAIQQLLRGQPGHLALASPRAILQLAPQCRPLTLHPLDLPLTLPSQLSQAFGLQALGNILLAGVRILEHGGVESCLSIEPALLTKRKAAIGFPQGVLEGDGVSGKRQRSHQVRPVDGITDMPAVVVLRVVRAGALQARLRHGQLSRISTTGIDHRAGDPLGGVVLVIADQHRQLRVRTLQGCVEHLRILQLVHLGDCGQSRIRSQRLLDHLPLLIRRLGRELRPVQSLRSQNVAVVYRTDVAAAPDALTH